MDDVFYHMASELPGMMSTRYTPSLAMRIKAYLEARYSERFSIGEVADHFGVHPNHLSRCFREEYQCSPKQFLTALKLEKARQMLTDTDMSVTLVASLLSYDDQHAFSRSFKKYHGIPPNACRKDQNKECADNKGTDRV